MWRKLFLLLLACCESDAQRDPALSYLLERTRREFVTVKELMAKGEDASSACAVVEDAVREVRARKRSGPNIPEWDRVCSRDAPLAYARALVKKIEAQVPEPDTCFELERVLTKLEEKHKDDPEVKTVGQKLRSLCP